MALITKDNTFTTGTTIIASEHNANFNTLYNEINGQLDNANIKSGAGITDGKLSQITTPAKVSGAAITLLTSVPSGAGELPLANIPSVDEDNMVSDSAILLPTQQSVKAYTDTGVATGILSAIEDYGTSASASTSKAQTGLKVCYGRLSISGNSSTSLSNLPFTSAASYQVTATLADSDSAITAPAAAIANSGSGATIYNHEGSTNNVNWIAIGT